MLSSAIASGLAAFGILAVSGVREFVSDIELESFNLLNEIRAQGHTCPKGFTWDPNPVPMKFDCRLWRAALLHAEDMSEHSYFSHDSRNGDTFFDRAAKQGIEAASQGENIGAGYDTAQDALDGWLRSDGHCMNMLNRYNVMIGVVRVDGQHWPEYYSYFWVQMFARSTQLATLDSTSCFPAPTMAPTRVPTLPPTPAPTMKTPKCKGSPPQFCRSICREKHCAPGKCWKRIGKCCTMKCKDI